jgi:dienelactone hydrolase
MYEGLLAWDDEFVEPRPGVLVSHTIRGRTDFEDSKALALAGLGFVGLALDLYGVDTRDSDIEAYRRLMNDWKADRPALQQRLRGWVDIIKSQSEVDSGALAAIGYCFGGLCVLDLARISRDLSGVASFHGLFDAPGNAPDHPISAKVLALHGWDDPLATPMAVEELAAELSGRGTDWQIHAYGNTLHAFTNPAANDNKAGTVYNSNADRRSWQALQNFLEELF